MSSIYLVFTRDGDGKTHCAQAQDDLDAAKEIARELVNIGEATSATVEEWSIGGEWYTSWIVYEYSNPEESNQ